MVKWQNSTPRLASTPERRNGNINLSKHFISSSGDRTHNQSVLQSHFVPLRPAGPLYKILLEVKISILYGKARYLYSIVKTPPPHVIRHHNYTPLKRFDYHERSVKHKTHVCFIIGPFLFIGFHVFIWLKGWLSYLIRIWNVIKLL